MDRIGGKRAGEDEIGEADLKSCGRLLTLPFSQMTAMKLKKLTASFLSRGMRGLREG